MYAKPAKLGTLLHDVFVFAALGLTALTYFLRPRLSANPFSTIWMVVFSVWLAFCVWTAFRTLSNLLRTGNLRAERFAAMLEQWAQAQGERPALTRFAVYTLIPILFRMAVPILLMFA